MLAHHVASYSKQNGGSCEECSILLSSLWLCVLGMESHISHSMHPIFPDHYSAKGRTPIPQRAVVIAICSLSAIGSLLIVLSFCCSKELRTKLRSYVLFISIMDIMYSSANLVGAGIDFAQYVNRTHSGWQFEPSPTLGAVCVAQGVFATYGTLSSILWTVCMAVYVYFGVLCYLNERYERMLQAIYWSSHIISWVLPLYVTAWALGLGQMTYSPWGSFGGWCTAMGNQDSTGSNVRLAVFMRSDYSTLSASLLILVFCSATLTILCSTVSLQRDLCVPDIAIMLEPPSCIVLQWNLFVEGAPCAVVFSALFCPYRRRHLSKARST